MPDHDPARRRLTRGEAHERIYRAALLLLSLLVFALHLSLYWHIFVDDSYILFRYARNLAQGRGLVYNPGERVEGTSSILWTVWISLGLKLGFEPLLFAKWTGALLGAGTLLYLSRRVHPLVSLCTACSGVFVYWCVAGLETPLFAFGLILALGELYAEHLRVAALCFGMLPWIRPDGLYFTALVLVPVLVLRWRGWRTALRLDRKIITTVAVAVALPCAILLFWRGAYYGDLQPNTYYAKVAMPWHDGFKAQLDEQGIPYVIGFWSSHVWLLVFGTASLAFAIWQRRAFLIVVHAALLLYQAYFVFVGGDWMPQFRWYAPLIPIYLAVVFSMLAFSFRARWVRWRPVWATLGMVVVGTSMIHQSVFGFISGGFLRYHAKHELYLQRLADLLRVTEPFSQSIILGDIGRIGYESEQRIVDAAGLVDRHVARIPAIHFWKADLPYLLTRNAEWVIIRFHHYFYPPNRPTMQALKEALAAQPDRSLFTPELWQQMAPTGRWTFERQLLGSPDFHARYSTVFVSPEFDQPQYTAVFCRRDTCDSDMARRLRSWSPNLGHVKAELGLADADYYLQRTMTLLENEETATVAYARRVGNLTLLRSVASNWIAPPWNRIEAYTALGLEEYKTRDFDDALRDFKSVVSLGGRQPYHFSNVGWALQALGQQEEATKWFDRGKTGR